jgi:hypothetical protein
MRLQLGKDSSPPVPDAGGAAVLVLVVGSPASTGTPRGSGVGAGAGAGLTPEPGPAGGCRALARYDAKRPSTSCAVGNLTGLGLRELKLPYA